MDEDDGYPGVAFGLGRLEAADFGVLDCSLGLYTCTKIWIRTVLYEANSIARNVSNVSLFDLVSLLL